MRSHVVKSLKVFMRQTTARARVSPVAPCFTPYNFSCSREFHVSRIRWATQPFLLADIGEGITECQIMSWFVKPGDRVEQFDKICEVQSDKAAVEITSRWDGTIKTLHYQVDDMAVVGQPLLEIDLDYIPSETQITSDQSGLEETVAEDLVGMEIQERGGPEAHPPSESNPLPIDQSLPAKLFQPRDEQDLKPSLLIPSVRHLLAELNIDVSDIQGSGKNGRITKEDVQRHHSAMATSLDSDFVTPAEAPIQLLTASAEDRLVPLTATEKMMFKTMTLSLRIPQFLYTHSIDLGAINSLRKQLNSSPANKSKLKLTLLPFLLKALSQALIEMPQLNAHLDDSEPNKPALLIKAAHHFGIAIDTPRGLLVPVIRNVEKHSISSLASELQRLSSLANDGKLQAQHFKDATFTVSNVGSIGGGVVSPIIVAPQVGIVAVGRMKEVPVFDVDENGKNIVVRREELVLSWSADHRVLDGATVARCAELVGLLVADVGELTVSLR